VVTRTTFLSATLIGLLALTGCANKRSQQSTARTNAPTYAPRANSQVYYQRAYQPGDAPPADLAWGDVYVDQQVYAQPVEQYPAEMVGYETMSSGEQVVVITYVHTYVDPIETYPRVYWAGRWYYNVGGTFVFWDPYWNTWTYYWGPPAPLVVAWNYHYPWVAYSWGVGYYGAGWYWGGVGYYGWHAYGRPPTGWRPSHGPNGDPGGPTDGGRPSHSPNGDGGGGGGGGDPMTGVEAGGTRPIAPPPTTGAGVVGDARDVAAPKDPARAKDGPGNGAPVVGAKVDDKPGRAPVDTTRTRVAAGGTDVKPPRAGAEPQRIAPSKPPRAPVATTTPTRSNEFATPRQQPARARVPAVVQVHDEHGGTTVRPTYDPPTARRTPTATVTRKPTTIGTTTNPTRASSSTPARASTPSSSGPTYRTVTPTRSSSSSPTRSSSSGSYSPSRSSSSGSSYSPSRSSYSPSRSSGGSSYSPSRSSGGSSYSPSRSSGGSSFSPSRSSGGSSFSPSRSSGGGGGGFSPSRGGGGGGHSAPARGRH
jgi:hypothetical protein